MRFYFSYTIGLDEGETAESLALQCQGLECPCSDLLYINGRCPLGMLEINGLCSLHTVENWEEVLQQERHEADI